MLTAKQYDLLVFIDQRLRSTGISPSFDEMKEALGLKSKSGVHRLITALEDRGFIRRLPNRARALEVLHMPPRDGEPQIVEAHQSETVAQDVTGDRTVVPFPRTAPPMEARQVDVPLHGRIAAGTPIEALEQVDSHIPVPADMLGPAPHFALTVDGDSMIEAGILDGDIVLIESCDTAHDGDIVVALVDNEEATLKTLRRLGPQVALIPANRAYETQTIEAGRVRVQGRLKGLIRRYH